MALMQRTAFSSATGRTRMSVVARAATKVAPPKVQVKKSGSGLAVLAKVEELGLLSKVQELGLLSKLEASGLTLSKIEESGLLTTLEKSGLLTVAADKGTPGLLSAAGYALFAAAAALVYFIGDDSTGELVAQAVGALALGTAGVAALVGAGLLSDLPKVA